MTVLSAHGPERPGPERPGPEYPPEWDDEYDDVDEAHDALHPWMFAGCDDCAERANWLETPA